MRAPWLALILIACGPKVSTTPISYDEDLAPKHAAEPEAPVATARPVAPPGKGSRTGAIPRDRLVAVLDAGPGAFLGQLEVTPRLAGEKFVGWQLVQLVDHESPLAAVDVVPGDVLLAINGKSLSRPDQLQAVWDSLRTSNEVIAQLWRGEGQFEIRFTIEPKL